jgi:hypothetical protein
MYMIAENSKDPFLGKKKPHMRIRLTIARE